MEIHPKMYVFSQLFNIRNMKDQAELERRFSWFVKTLETEKTAFEVAEMEQVFMNMASGTV